MTDIEAVPDAWRAAAVVIVLVVVLAAGHASRRRRAASYAPPVDAVDPATLPAPLTAPLTAVYFTSRLCGACKDTPHIVREAAPEVPSIAVDVSANPHVARALAVVETPTLLLVDERGRIRYARAGNPTPAELWTYVREAWDSLEAQGLRDVDDDETARHRAVTTRATRLSGDRMNHRPRRPTRLRSEESLK